MSEEATARRPQFTDGDVVLLRSGGPAMTVYRVGLPGDDEILYETCWFRGGDLMRDTFTEVEIILVGKRPLGWSADEAIVQRGRQLIRGDAK